jgi:Flp pilus assembly protein TadG
MTVMRARLSAMNLSDDRGAAAVEFALLLPVLIAILLGIIEFGLAFNSQLQVTNAAREGARAAAVWSVSNSSSTAVISADKAATTAAAALTAPALTNAMIGVTFSSSTGTTLTACASSATVSVTISYPYKFLTGWFGKGYTQTGKSAMRCGG